PTSLPTSRPVGTWATRRSVCSTLGLRAIRPAEEPHPLDLLEEEGGQRVAPKEFHPPDVATIGHGQRYPLRVELLPGALLLHRAAMVAEARAALLARALRLAGGGEAIDRQPGAGGRHLAGLGGMGRDEGDRVGQAAARRLQVVGGDAAPLHP